MLANALRDCSAARLQIIGHTDSLGDANFNLTVSRRRAAAVGNYLLRQGIDQARLESIGRGEVDPVAPNNSAAGRRQNRRIEFRLALIE